MLWISGDPSLGDALERLAFNALPAALSVDCWRHQYDQQVNQIEVSAAQRGWSNNGPGCLGREREKKKCPSLYLLSIHIVLFPMYLRGLSPDLVHVPLNRVPLLMIQPYVVTVHDLANLFFEWEEYSKLRIQLRRYRLKRGLARASRVIAVSEATRRDVAQLAGVAPHRMRLVYNAPDPGFIEPDGPDGAEERRRIMERYQIQHPFLLYAGNIRRHKNKQYVTALLLPSTR